MRTAIQLYTLRALEYDLPALLQRVAETGFEGVEFAGLDRPDAVTDALSETGLAVAGAHVGIDALEGSFVETIERYRRIGCETLVVPYLDPAAFETREATERTADRLSTLAERVADEGSSLWYHNHDHEFVDRGGETAFEVIAERADDTLGFEVDLGWVAAAGYDPAATLAAVADRTSLVHLKDVRVRDRTPVELGADDLDLNACIEAAERAGVEWVIYEHDRPTDPERSLVRGGERSRTLTEGG